MQTDKVHLGDVAERQLNKARAVPGTSCVLGSSVFIAQFLLVTEVQNRLAGTSLFSLRQGDGLQGWTLSQRWVGSRGEAKPETYGAGK